jgi:SEL1 protein
VANELSLSGGPLVQRIKLMEELDNPNYNSGIVDSDLLDYYKMLANKGDAQAQVQLTNNKIIYLSFCINTLMLGF